MSRSILVVAASAVFAAFALPSLADDDLRPLKLANDPQPLLAADQPPSVYDLPTPPTEQERVNAGGINLDIKVTYFSDYIYRGVNRSEYIGEVTGRTASNNANFQFDGKLSFDLGKFPHPFIGIFTNVLDSDPVSNFQEVRPYFGFDWPVRPLVISVGNSLYEFPDRGELNTSEVWLNVKLDDSVLLKSDQPLLSPYIFVAYDYDLYEGWYLEGGISHDFTIEKTGITLTPLARIAYVINNPQFSDRGESDSGFQHWEVGIVGKYSLNNLLNIPLRYGQWSLNGYLFYTNSIDSELRAEDTVWGGFGIQLTY